MSDWRPSKCYLICFFLSHFSIKNWRNFFLFFSSGILSYYVSILSSLSTLNFIVQYFFPINFLFGPVWIYNIKKKKRLMRETNLGYKKEITPVQGCFHLVCLYSILRIIQTSFFLLFKPLFPFQFIFTILYMFSHSLFQFPSLWYVPFQFPPTLYFSYLNIIHSIC